MDRKTLAVVITYRAPERLASCMAALKDQCEYFVVDNTNNNILYTKAVNVGLREAFYHSGGEAFDYALILCDDVLVAPGCVSKLTKFMDENPKCAIASPLQHHGEQVTCGGVLDCWPGGVHRAGTLKDYEGQAPFQQPWANGACFLVRLSAVREFGLMDPAMRFICSDADYGLTARYRGYECWLLPDARVEHKPNLAARPSPEIAKVMAEDQQAFFRKWVMSGLFHEYAYEGSKVPPGLINHYAKQLQEALARP